MKNRSGAVFVFNATMILMLPGLALTTLRAQQVGNLATRDVNQVEAVYEDENDTTQGNEGSAFLMTFPRAGIFNSDQDPATTNPQNGGKTPPAKAYVFPDKHKRFKRYVLKTVGPYAFLGAGFGALIDHSYNRPREWGKTPTGFGKRLASSFGTNLVQQTTKYGLSEALKLDSSFQKSSKNGFGARAKDAISQVFTSRTRSGGPVFSVPKLAGYFATGIVPLTWKPDRLTFGDGLRSSGFSVAGAAAGNLVSEFLFRK